MDRPVVTYAPRPDATPETELSVLVQIYALALAAAERKEAVEPRQADDLDDGTGFKGGSADVSDFTRL